MSKKFTLLELLIVIAVIGILLSILLPSLSKSRHVAYQAVCMSNQSQQTSGTMGYLKDNDQKMMPVNFFSNNRYNQSHPHNNYYLRYTRGFASSNQGVLYVDGYLDTAKVFYCPGLENGDGQAKLSSYDFYVDEYNGYPTPERFKSMGASNKVRGSYYFNPYGQEKRFKNFLKMENDDILFMDLVKENTLSHRMLGNRWVVLRTDASARIVTSDEAFAKISSTGVNDSWSHYEDVLDEISSLIE